VYHLRKSACGKPCKSNRISFRVKNRRKSTHIFPRCSPHAAASDKNRLFKRNHENERKEEIPNPWANPNAGHFMVRPK